MTKKKTSNSRIFLGSILGIFLGIGGMLIVSRVLKKNNLPEAEFSIKSGPGLFEKKYLHLQRPPEELLEELKKIWGPLVISASSVSNRVTNVVECILYRAEKGKTWAGELPPFRVFLDRNANGVQVVFEAKGGAGKKWTKVSSSKPESSEIEKFIILFCERYRDEMNKVWKSLEQKE